MKQQIKLNPHPIKTIVSVKSNFTQVSEMARYGTLEQDAQMINPDVPRKIETEIGLNCPFRKKK